MDKSLGVDDYDLKYWMPVFGSKPVERIAHEDFAGSYEKCECHVFRLENNQYAVVAENGCSCYSADDAQIELFPTEQAAMESFEKWIKQNR